METLKEDGAHTAPKATEETQHPPQEELLKKVQELETLAKEKEQKYLYLYAEFENFKKRAIKERSDALKFGWEPLAHDLLGVMDNLDRAVSHIPAGTDAALADGLRMILNQFDGALNRQGVKTIETCKQVFDPNLHEAVGTVESDLPSGTISQEQLKGYTLHGRLLRPARVLISKGKN